MTMRQHPPGESVDVSNYSSAEQRRTVERGLNRSLGIIVALLLTWLIIGVFRTPPASWQERAIVGLFAACFAAPIILSWPYRKALPALDRRSRTAIVTGRKTFNAEPDPDSDMPTYDLVTVTVDVDGVATDTMIADIVSVDDLDRFAIGSAWNVYVFRDPAALNNDPDRTRVILTEVHDDVVRAGYDLGFYTLHNEPGPGSDLLLRRFANERPPSGFGV